MYKEIEINTPLELARYLVNEGDLYAGEQKIRLTTAANVAYNSPFRWINKSGGSTALHAEWDVSEELFYKKLNWYDCIPEGKKVPCYVSDSIAVPSNEVLMADVVYRREGSAILPYVGHKKSWRYATPIPADELWVPE